MDSLRSLVNYPIPQDVQQVLRLARQIVFIPKDEENDFPSALIILDGTRLKKDETDRREQCTGFYETIFNHIMDNKPPLDFFRCNFTSDFSSMDAKTAEGTRAIADSLPKPHQQDFESMPDNAYLKPDYVIRIENNCDDDEEHTRFKEMVQSWKKFLAVQRRI